MSLSSSMVKLIYLTKLLLGYVMLPRFVWYNEFTMVQYIVSRASNSATPSPFLLLF